MMIRYLLQALILAGLTVTTAGTSRADLIFDLTPATLSASPGGTVEFTGSLSNTGVADVFLNGDLAVFLNPSLVLDDSPFFANAPLSLAAGGGSYSGPFFDVIVSFAASPGPYSGSFTIEGGVDPSTFENLATETFQVNVTSPSSVPEPSSFVLLATSLMSIVIVRARVHNAHRNSGEQLPVGQYRPARKNLKRPVSAWPFRPRGT